MARRGGPWRVPVASPDVQALDRRHTVPLPHQPAAGFPRQGVQRQVGGVAGHHVQGATGVPLGLYLEVARFQGHTVQAHAPGIGHVHHQP